MAVYVAGRLSGAHLNPAVTVALATFKGFPVRKIMPYIGAQVAGAFVGALLVRFTYPTPSTGSTPTTPKQPRASSSTSPDIGVTLFTAFFDQVIGTAILVAVIFALTSAVNNPPMANTGPLIIGLLVVGIGLGWGANAGYAINPPGTSLPRLASWLTGYHDAWFSTNGPEMYFWVPIIAPLIGGLIGGALFVFCIEVPAGGDHQSCGDRRRRADRCASPMRRLDRFFEITERGSTPARRSAAELSPSSRWPTSSC